jgi:hypothetical protein
LTLSQDHRAALQADVAQLRATLEAVRMESVLVQQENNAMMATFEANETKINELTEALQGSTASCSLFYSQQVTDLVLRPA